MQANLVFSPFARPALPLGIATIKAYVENNSNFKVKCFDMNAKYYNTLYEAIRDNKINELNKTGFQIDGQARETFLKWVSILTTRNDAFFNENVYDLSAMTFNAYFDKMNGLFHKACSNSIIDNGPAPWFIREYADQLLRNSPDVVGFSIMVPDQFCFSVLVARLLKAANNKIKVVLGGYIPTLIYRDILNHKCFDFIVVNEGEKTFLDLLRAFDKDKEIDNIANLAFRKKGEIVLTEPSVIEDLDEVAFADFSDLDKESYFAPDAVVPILTSRGCYWRRCTFCVHHKSYFNKYRSASVKHVVDELEYHVSNGSRYFNLVDEMISASRFRKISEEVIRRDLEINYYALAKPTCDFTKDILDVMYKSGCRYIIWGVESGCQRILDLIDKGTVVEDMSDVLTNSSFAGIKNHVFLIIGFPTETREELKQTLDFLYELKDHIHAVHKGAFLLKTGSTVYEHPEKFGITKIYPANSPMESVKFDVSEGIKQDELQAYVAFYGKNYFKHFNYFSDYLVINRNHALYLYSNSDKLVFSAKKAPVPLPTYPTASEFLSIVNTEMKK